MMENLIPNISESKLKEGIAKAISSARQRHPQLLHEHGAEFNQVFNFMMQDSYMQPHLHPGDEKIERIHIIQGKVATFFFDEHGRITRKIILERGAEELIEVPVFTWHTYVILSDIAVTYETMMGVYAPDTWKKFAPWAPTEASAESQKYLSQLRDQATSGVH